MEIFDPMLKVAARLWGASPIALRRAILLGMHGRYLLGVVGLVFDEQRRLLLLEHRFRTPWRWGLPGGFLRQGEHLEDALRRELFEEVGLEVEVSPGIFDTEHNARAGYVSIALVGRAKNPDALALDRSHEILQGGFFAESELPPDIYPHHERVVRRFWQQTREGTLGAVDIPRFSG